MVQNDDQLAVVSLDCSSLLEGCRSCRKVGVAMTLADFFKSSLHLETLKRVREIQHARFMYQNGKWDKQEVAESLNIKVDDVEIMMRYEL